MQCAIPFWQYGDGTGGGLSAVLSTNNLEGYGFYTPPPPIPRVYTGDSSGTGATVTCIPSGGTPPYTYLWSESGGPTAEVTCVSPTAATTAFYSYDVPDYSYTVDYICTVTDAAMASAASGSVQIILEQNT